MIDFIEKHFKFWAPVALVLVVTLVFLSWKQEHDAHILAEQHVQESAARVADLEKQVQDVDAAGKAKLALLQKQAASVKTPAQAIATIPTVTDVPLNIRPLPDAPSAVQVDALPLFQELAHCKAQGVELDACTQKLVLQGKITDEEKGQVTALKGKGTFWQRLGKGAKIVGCAAGGGALGGLSKQPGGAAIGAGVGAGLCSIL